VDITLQDNVLTISGERKAEQEKERGGTMSGSAATVRLAAA
jgi:HSP20 family molecular chaperone IbpA